MVVFLLKINYIVFNQGAGATRGPQQTSKRAASYILVKNSGIPEEHFAFKILGILKFNYFNYC